MTITTSASSSKDERINLRLNVSAKNLLERAASFEGKTVSNFILNHALESAEKTIKEHEIMHLSVRESETFFNALAAPVQFNDKLIEALAEHAERVISK